MASYIKSKVQQSLSFLLVLVIAFSVFSGFLFLNPSPSYAYSRNFSNANFIGADLSGENFSNANLSGADLSGADLSGKDLSNANFSNANLSGADLSGADLRRARLSGARLSGAIANRLTQFPAGFNAVRAGVDIRP